MSEAVEFRGMTKRFGDVTAIDDISFSVGKGETIALLGPSGCGKTTILRMIAGFENADNGSVMVDGKDMAGLRPYERNVGLLFQHYALFPHMSVAENIAYGLRHRGYERGAIPARVAEMLELVRLPGFGARRPDQLSGGQQQRVALARALAIGPSLLLLDEPLSALDAKLRHDLRIELKQVLAAVGSTAIVVTHDQEEAMSLGERVFVMSHGKIMQIGSPNDVYWRPNSRFIAEFMGRANWLRGRLVAKDATTATFRSVHGWEMPVPAVPALPEGEIDLCVRPETLDVSPVSDAAAPTGLVGRVEDVVPLGAVLQMEIALGGDVRILATQPNRPDRLYRVGQQVQLSVQGHETLFYPAQMGT